MLRVCALANRIGGPDCEHVLALERSLSRKKVPFFLSIESGEWNWKRKVEWELEWAERHPDDLFVFIDAFDYLFLGELDELEFLVRQTPLLFSCDAGRLPYPIRSLAGRYDTRRRRHTKWCWLNGSGPAGKGSHIAEAAGYGLAAYPRDSTDPFWAKGTDQLFWTHVYLDGFGELDQFCRLTQPLWDDENPGENNDDWITPHLAHRNGRVVNLQTNQQPQFLHATAHSWAAIPKELIP